MPDTVYLVERVSITTKAGVFGFPPGTRLQVLARRGETLTVKAADSQFDVRADQVTSDVELARSLGHQDASQQAAIQQQAAENAARVREANARQQQSAAEKSAASKPAHDSRLVQLQKKETLLKLQLERLREDWRDLQQHDPKTSPNAYALKQQIRAVERELLDVRQQQTILRMELR
jgi:hypothetical protein